MYIYIYVFIHTFFHNICTKCVYIAFSSYALNVISLHPIAITPFFHLQGAYPSRLPRSLQGGPLPTSCNPGASGRRNASRLAEKNGPSLRQWPWWFMAILVLRGCPSIYDDRWPVNLLNTIHLGGWFVSELSLFRVSGHDDGWMELGIQWPSE